jgi:hypothetical protein
MFEFWICLYLVVWICHVLDLDLDLNFGFVTILDFGFKTCT